MSIGSEKMPIKMNIVYSIVTFSGKIYAII